MKPVKNRLEDLRAAMKDSGCDIYIMPSSDPHSSEYAPAHFTVWEYFSGFPCENSTMAVAADTAALWVDGRFFTAADKALEGTGIESMHMGVSGVPDFLTWLSGKLQKGSTAGYDGRTMPLYDLRKLRLICKNKGAELKDLPLPDRVWTEDRPPLPSTPLWILDTEYTGKSAAEKIKELRAAIKEQGCTAIMMTRLDCIAWLLNIRASDIEDTPYALCFLYTDMEKTVLFTELKRVSDDIKKELEADGIEIKNYGDIFSFAENISSDETVSVEPSGINAALYSCLENNPHTSIKEKENPVSMMKAVKNETELACSKRAHIHDGVSMVRFNIELEKRLASGESLRETDIDKILHKYRSSSDKFITESFTTIAAWGENAAMMHYFPKEGADSPIKRRGFLLVDSGATYLDGTTDITRTYTSGELTDEERLAYTRVLRCHIDLAMAVWREGATGGELDMLARAPMWKQMLDYRCGTGHSVSHVGAVHEGPHSLRPHNSVKFVPGMVITDEPGIYEEGKYGIRIENELFCTEAGVSPYGRFLCFEPLTFVPIDLEPVIKEELSKEEKEWLNSYHKAVYEKLSGELDEEEKTWLYNKCRAI